jgi:hypothetical protein
MDHIYTPESVLSQTFFCICDDTSISVADCASKGWQIGFRRMLDEVEMQDWRDLQTLMNVMSVSTGEDRITWGLTSSKQFTTSSLYRFMTTGGVSSKMAKCIWGSKIPLKIKIFLWQIFQDRLQTAQQLKSRKWKCDVHCTLCGGVEDIDHLLFRCPMAVFVCAFLRVALGWNGQPISCNNLTSAWLKGGFGVSQQLGLTCFASFAWEMWITRSKMRMQKTFPGKLTDVIYIGLSFIQKWKILAKPVAKSKMEEMIELVLRHLRV